MSKDIEERVAKISLDAYDFNKYAKETIDTLGRFEDKFSHFAKSTDIAEFGSNVISGMQDVIKVVDQTGKKYSWLEQIAVGAYRKIGETVLNFGKNEVMKLTGISQAAAGWQKYESEVEAVQSIMNATGLEIGDVEEQLKKLSWYTDETSYHYNDMVSNIAKFNAAGVTDLGKATDSMIGIANMAGYFGVSANKATGAMEGFAKAMGMGYMDQQSWRRIETAGMNAMTIQKAFLDTAVKLGKLGKKDKNTYTYGSGKALKEFKASEFKTVLKYRWLDQEVMNKTFQKYGKSVNDIYKAWLEGGETELVSELIDKMGDSLDQTSIKAFEAAQQAKTFTDVIGSLEEVVASGWRNSFKYIFGNYEEAKELWTNVVNELWDIFAESGYKRNDLLKGWYEGGGRDKLLEGVANMWYGVMAIINPIKEAFDQIFPYTTVERLLKLTEAFKNFSEKFRSWFDFGFTKEKDDGVEDTVTELETFEDAVKRTQKNLDKLYNEVNAGKWGHMWERWKALGEAGYVWQIVQNEVNKRYTEAGVGYYPNRYEVVDDGTVKYREKEVKATDKATESINKISAAQLMAERRSDNLMRAMRGLFAAIDLVKDVVAEVSKFFGKLFGKTIEKLSPTFDRLLKKAGRIGDIFFELRSTLSKVKLSEIFESAAEKASDFIAWFINDAIPNVGKVLGWIVEKIQNIGDFIWPIAKVLAGVIYWVVTSLPGWITKAYKKIKPLFDGMKNTLSPTLQTVKDWFKNDALPFIENLPNTVIPFFTDLYQNVSNFVTRVWNNITNSDGFILLKTTITNVWTTIKEFALDVWGYLQKTGSKIVEMYDGFMESYKTETGFDWAKLTSDGIDWVMTKLASVLELAGKAVAGLKDMFKMFDENGEAQGMVQVTASLDNTAQNLDNFGKNILLPIRKTFEDVFNWLKNVNTLLNDPVGETINLFKRVADGIMNMFEGLNLEKIAQTFKDTGIGLFFAALAKNMATGAISIASIPSAFASVLWSIKEVLVAYSRSVNARAVLNIAKAVGLLVLSIIALSAIPTQQLTDITANLAVLGLVASLIMFMMALIEKWKKVQEQGKSIIQVAGTYEFNGSDMAKAMVQPFREFFTTLGFQIGKMFKSIGRSFRILSFAVSIMLIVNTIRDIYDWFNTLDLDDHRVREKLWAAVTAVIVIGGLLLLASKIAAKHDNNATVGGALSFVTMAIAVAVLMKVIKQVAEWDIGTLDKGVLAVTMVGLVLFALAKAVNETQTKSMNLANGSSSKTKNHVMQLAFLIATFTVAFIAISIALLAIGSMNPGSLLVALITMGVFALVIAGLGSIAKEIGDNAKNILKGVAAIGAVTLLATLLIGLFSVIGGMMTVTNGWANLLWGGLAVVGVLAAMALMVKLLQDFGANEALSKFAESMSKFGFGVVAFAVAVYIFAKTMPIMIESITLLGEKLNDPATREKFIHGLMAIGIAILTALVLMKVPIAQGIVQIFQTIFGALKGQWNVMLKQLGGLVTSLIGWITGNKVWLIAAIGLLIVLLFGFLYALIPTIVDNLVKLIITIILTVAKTLQERAGQLIQALGTLVLVIINLLLKAIGKLVEVIVSTFAGKKAGEAVANWVEKAIDTRGVSKVIDDQLDDLKKETNRYETEATKLFNDAKKNIANNTDGGLPIRGALTPNKDSSGGGGTNGLRTSALVQPVGYAGVNMPQDNSGMSGIVNTLTEGKDTILSGATEAFSPISETLGNEFDLANLTAETGMGDLNQLLSSYGIDTTNVVDTTGDDINQSIDKTGQEAIDTVEEHGRIEIETIKTHAGERYNMMTGEWEKVAGAEKESLHIRRTYRAKQAEKDELEAQQQAKKVLRDPYIDATAGLEEELKKRAQNIVNTYFNEFCKQEVIARARGVGSTLANNILVGHDIRAAISSPSREMIWRGQMMVTGLVSGVMNNIAQAEMAGVTLASSMLGSVSSVIENNPDLTPTITPVINTAGVRTDFGLIDGMFGKTALSSALASDALTGFNQNQVYKQTQIDNINTNNADVVATLGMLREDINGLNDSFANTQVVLDSGALVGATAKQMDNALGRIQVYKGRGI